MSKNEELRNKIMNEHNICVVTYPSGRGTRYIARIHKEYPAANCQAELSGKNETHVMLKVCRWLVANADIL